MKQVLQDLRSGRTNVTDVPAPQARAGCLLVATRRSLISAGTERMLVEFGKASLLAKARSQPDKVRQVLDKIRTDGLLATMEAVFSRLDEPLPLGYCNAGVVLEVGSGVSGFAPGDRVASNAPHAEIAAVPVNLAAKIPDSVSDDQAAFTVLASIALQGIRLLSPTLGERMVVYGLGLIGLVAVQLLRASGCEVLGVDIDPRRLALARSLGAAIADASTASAAVAASAWTQGRGADGVLITASAPSDEIMHASAQLCRKRGRIVLVGVVGLNLRRSDFYEKEITFQVSCSYGPGRYDDKYELGGQDYPYGLVRWTEQRNFQAVLDSLAAGRLDVVPLITHRLKLDDAAQAYETLSSDRSALGIVLEYPADASRTPCVTLDLGAPQRPHGKPSVGFSAEQGNDTPKAHGRLSVGPLADEQGSPIPVVAGVIGGGNFSKMTLLPALAKSGASIAYVADLSGAAAHHLARKFGAAQAATDHKLLLADPKVNLVLIATGHSSHAALVCEALAAGKHVFVEKPLAMSPAELSRVAESARRAPAQRLTVGFNRRFAPHVVRMKRLLAGRGEPLAMTMTVNAGAIPPEHWVHDPVRGGGRIVGEACHFIDLMVHLAGAKVVSVSAVMAGAGPAVREDKMSIALAFEDGSVGSVNYFANGHKGFSKEILEVFSDGRILRLDNFRRLDGWGFSGFSKMKTWRQDKGHRGELAELVTRLACGGPAMIELDELVNVTLASFAAMTAAREGRTVRLADEYAATQESRS